VEVGAPHEREAALANALADLERAFSVRGESVVLDLNHLHRNALEGALQRAGAEKSASRRRSLERLGDALAHLSPRARWAVLGGRLASAGDRLETAEGRSIAGRRNRVAVLAGTLDALSPLGVLGRGYSICRRLPGLEIVKDAAAVTAGGEIEVLLHRGRLWCTVKGQRT